MRSMRQRLAAVTLLSGLMVLGLGLAAGPATAAVDEYCLGDTSTGSLQVATTPDAGSEVEPGSEIAVAAAWDAQDFTETDRLVVCATVDGVFNEAMSSQHKGLHNDGEHTAAATVPADVAPGSDVCIVGVVKGRFTGGDPSSLMVSEEHCFRTAAAVEPKVEPTTTTTTTTVPAEPIVEPASVQAPAPAVEMAPAVEPAPLPELPRTGASIGLLAGFGGISLALGGVTRFLGRRRPADG